MAKGEKGEENVGMEEEAKAEEEDASKDGEEAHGSKEKKEMATGEELKRGGKHKKRARGGSLKAEEEHKHSLPSHTKPEHPHHHHGRKSGGHVPGKMAEMRPDRRARGGATSDMNPTTAAGNMSVPSYEKQPKIPNGGGMGKDMSPYHGGGHRRPG